MQCLLPVAPGKPGPNEKNRTATYFPHGSEGLHGPIKLSQTPPPYQPRSQGLSSYRLIELQEAVRWETLGTRLPPYGHIWSAALSLETTPVQLFTCSPSIRWKSQMYTILAGNRSSIAPAVEPVYNGPVYSCFDKGCPTTAQTCTRQCRLVLV